MPACRSCSAPIEFETTESGKLRPLNPDGTVHFATRPSRKDRPALPDNVCTACGSLDVERMPGKGPHVGAIRCRDCRAWRWLRKPADA